MIPCTNLANLDPLPKPSVTTGWGRTCYHGDDWVSDGGTLLPTKLVPKATLAAILRHAAWPRRPYAMNDPDGPLLDRLWKERLTAHGEVGVALDLLGCVADGTAMLRGQKPFDFVMVTTNAGRLSFAAHVTKADAVWGTSSRLRWLPLLLLRAGEPVALVARLS
jgi:hypothetical protein